MLITATTSISPPWLHHFNQRQIVVEEAGEEHYVHLRSVDDEYEHLESTLPPRAGGAAGQGTADDFAAGADTATDVPCGNEAEINPAFDRGESAFDAEQRAESVHGGGTWTVGSTPDEENGGQGNSEGQRSGQQRFARRQSDERWDAEDDLCRARGNHPDRPRRMSSPLSPQHHRSPSCSPRLSPRLARSPYRRAGIGGRERGGHETVPDKSVPVRLRAQPDDSELPQGTAEGEDSARDARDARLERGAPCPGAPVENADAPPGAHTVPEIVKDDDEIDQIEGWKQRAGRWRSPASDELHTDRMAPDAFPAPLELPTRFQPAGIEMCRTSVVAGDAESSLFFDIDDGKTAGGNGGVSNVRESDQVNRLADLAYVSHQEHIAVDHIGDTSSQDEVNVAKNGNLVLHLTIPETAASVEAYVAAIDGILAGDAV